MKLIKIELKEPQKIGDKKINSHPAEEFLRRKLEELKVAALAALRKK